MTAGRLAATIHSCGIRCSRGDQADVAATLEQFTLGASAASTCSSPRTSSARWWGARARRRCVGRRGVGSDATRGSMRSRRSQRLTDPRSACHSLTHHSRRKIPIGKHASIAPLSGHNSEISRCPRVNGSLTDVRHPYGASAAVNTAPVRRLTSDLKLMCNIFKFHTTNSNSERPPKGTLLRGHVLDTRLATYRARELMACDQGDESGDSIHLSYTLRLCHGCSTVAKQRSTRLQQVV